MLTRLSVAISGMRAFGLGHEEMSHVQNYLNVPRIPVHLMCYVMETQGAHTHRNTWFIPGTPGYFVTGDSRCTTTSGSTWFILGTQGTFLLGT